MEKRRLELIEAECRRHAALARVDAARRAEHEEVAEALAWALRCLGKEEPINRAHRYFTVRVDTGRGILRESFKF